MALPRRTELRRTPFVPKPRPATRKTPRNTRPSDTTVKLVRARDGGVCVICGRPGTDWDTLVPHHRRNRAMGGSKNPAINQPSNLLLVHGTENSALESATREDFYTWGWKLRDVGHALVVPVLYADGTRWLLDDEGGRQAS